MQPLAAQLRPQSLEEFVGQEHLVGPQKPLRIALEQNTIFSMIFWGPPGVGKTTLARILAARTNREFFELSAVSAGKAEVRAIVQKAEDFDNPPVLFIDEIHRFNKAQQDFLLPYVERGVVVLIGATTENPSFEVISALLSRTRVFVLKPLAASDLELVIKRVEEIFQDKLPKGITQETKDWLVQYANGDARKLLTLVENTLQLYDGIDVDLLTAALQSPHLRYDKTGDEHYDTISAFIKSMRASQTDAALYYLARMVAAGEDPKFIARRMIIFASEDVGLAAPTALVVANAVFEAVTKIGYPEAQVNLAHGVAYLCQCKKDRSAYNAYFKALSDVETHGNLPIPLHIRNAPTKLMKNLGYGDGYEMYSDTSYLPKKISKHTYLASNPSKK